jgi:hypothetical protein
MTTIIDIFLCAGAIITIAFALHPKKGKK